MGLENNFRYISDLNVANPGANDLRSEGDDHIRGIKNVLKNQFPNLGQTVIIPTGAQINALNGYVNSSGSVESRLAALEGVLLDAGAGGWSVNSINEPLIVAPGVLKLISPAQQFPLTGNFNIVHNASDGSIAPVNIPARWVKLNAAISMTNGDSGNRITGIGFGNNQGFIYTGSTQVELEPGVTTTTSVSTVIPAVEAGVTKYFLGLSSAQGFSGTLQAAMFWIEFL